MKKLLMFVAFVAMCVTASAQSAGMKKYADQHMSLEYPEEFTAGDGNEYHFQARAEDNFSMLDLKLSTMASNLNQMKEWCQEKKDNVNDDEDGTWTAGNIEVKGQLVSVRCDGEQEVMNNDTYKYDMTKVVKIAFTLTTPNKMNFKGEMYYKLADEAKMKPAFEKMLASLKAIK